MQVSAGILTQTCLPIASSAGSSCETPSGWAALHASQTATWPCMVHAPVDHVQGNVDEVPDDEGQEDVVDDLRVVVGRGGRGGAEEGRGRDPGVVKGGGGSWLWCW